MAGTWQPLANQPSFHTSTMILLTDGRLMVQEEATKHWHALTLAVDGSYVDGTWSTLADMSFWRRYYASGVLMDGRVIVIGGEQSGDVGDTTKGEIYDPELDAWSPIPSPPGWAMVGDAACCVFPDGRFMIGALTTTDCAIYDPTTNAWSVAASKSVRSNEETWILLPDNTIVTPQCFRPYHSEKYGISSNAWKGEGALPVPVVDTLMHEIGPGMLLYNGHVIYFGAANVHGHGKTVIYTPPPMAGGTGAWVDGPDIPTVGDRTIVSNDCPASLMPNGKVLFTGAPFERNDWGNPIYFFEYDSYTNTITQASTPPNNAAQLYWSRMMLLPTGQVLFSPSSNNVQCYTPDGGPDERWRPTIYTVQHECGTSPDDYLLRGTQLNGWSQANTYGDDCYAATNYPLVRLRNPVTGSVHFCRTRRFSTMGVATGASIESCLFSVAGVPHGDYDLCVIANGIASHCVRFCHHVSKPTCCCTGDHRVETCCTHGDIMVDPEVIQHRGQLKALQDSIGRITSLIKVADVVRQPKERRDEREEEEEEEGKARRLRR